jgi:hypothetical protein
MSPHTHFIFVKFVFETGSVKGDIKVNAVCDGEDMAELPGDGVRHILP